MPSRTGWSDDAHRTDWVEIHYTFSIFAYLLTASVDHYYSPGRFNFLSHQLHSLLGLRIRPVTRGMSTLASAVAPAPYNKAKAAKPKVPVSHPPVIDMVKTAITSAKDRKGISLPIIKKYIAANYKLDVGKLGPQS
ncbi:hypothetical protein PHET_04363 [Paragonimus heterotremus]|uniref:H15 domain-containing protein n=1 Tax=Paragonimus heterotremus TaxID=100268 RepID=A0A8J4WHF4_9TREM|nr:hypothetical protein PHET_04363 [Paragonimus heterotremus]